jgi:ABC-type sugar transport system ATPase subunit
MARGLIKKLEIVSRDERQMVNSLSGGNQQKVALGKWIRNDLKLIIMDEPLQGIDIGAKIDILRSIRTSVLDRGGAAIWLESDIEFVPDYADRVLVMRDGCITHELTHKPISLDEMMMALYGTVHR